MQQKHHVHTSARWFKQWSRKAYAMFSSMDKVVHIGHLSVDVSGKSLQKLNACGHLSINGTSGESNPGATTKFSTDDELETLFLAITTTLTDVLNLHKPACSAACSRRSLSEHFICLINITSKPVFLNRLKGYRFFHFKTSVV